MRGAARRGLLAAPAIADQLPLAPVGALAEAPSVCSERLGSVACDAPSGGEGAGGGADAAAEADAKACDAAGLGLGEDLLSGSS